MSHCCRVALALSLLVSSSSLAAPPKPILPGKTRPKPTLPTGPTAKPAASSSIKVVVVDPSTDEQGLRKPAVDAIANSIAVELGRYPSLDVTSGRDIREMLKLEGV